MKTALILVKFAKSLQSKLIIGYMSINLFCRNIQNTNIQNRYWTNQYSVYLQTKSDKFQEGCVNGFNIRKLIPSDRQDDRKTLLVKMWFIISDYRT